MFGPVLKLKIKGAICPCLETPQDKLARSAMTTLTGYPIRYYKRQNDDSNNDGKSSLASTLSGFFSGSGNNKSGDSKNSLTISNKGIEGCLSIEDGANGNPCLHFKQKHVEEEDDSELYNEYIDNDEFILLTKVGEFKGISESSFLSSKSRVIVSIMGRDRTELIRFELLPTNTNSTSTNTIDVMPPDDVTRDDIINKLFDVLEWDRKRRGNEITISTSNENNNNNNNSQDQNQNGTRNGVVSKASKIKHFAQREIELQKMKREREQKKNRYLKESGGLKYTALAMANREMS